MPKVTMDGLGVHYRAPRGTVAGPGEQVLVLVHGAAGSGRHWEPLMAHLAPAIAPIAPDLPGHGKSEGYALGSIPEAAAFLEDFLRAIGVEGQFALAGHSLGSLVALQVALTWPARVRRLVLVAAAAQVTLHPDFLAQATSGQWNLAELRLSFAPDIPADVVDLVLGEAPATRLPPGADDYMGSARCDLRGRLAAVHPPALVIRGDNDVILSPRKSLALAQGLGAARTINVRGGGHYLHVEQPEVAAAAIDEFLGIATPMASTRRGKRNEPSS